MRSRVHQRRFGVGFESGLDRLLRGSRNLLGLEVLELVRDAHGEESDQVGVDHDAARVRALPAEGHVTVPGGRQRVTGLEAEDRLHLASDHRQEVLRDQGIRLLANVGLEAVGVHPEIELLELTERGQHLRPRGRGVLLGESQGDGVGLEARLFDQGRPSLASFGAGSGAVAGGSRSLRVRRLVHRRHWYLPPRPPAGPPPGARGRPGWPRPAGRRSERWHGW